MYKRKILVVIKIFYILKAFDKNSSWNLWPEVYIDIYEA